MIDRDKVSGLKYLIIVGIILAFMVLVSSSGSFAQWSSFNGGYGYPGGIYGGYSRYGYPGSLYGGYSGYSYPGSIYGGYPGGYVSWSGPFAYSQDSSKWVPLYQYSSGPGPGMPNLANPIYGLVSPWYSQLVSQVTHQYIESSPLLSTFFHLSLISDIDPASYASLTRAVGPLLSPFL